jgi:hypothetical protein
MTLSAYVLKLKARGTSKPDALLKARAQIKKAGKRWTASVEELFQTTWRKRVPKAAPPAAPTPKPAPTPKKVQVKTVNTSGKSAPLTLTELKSAVKRGAIVPNQNGTDRESRIEFFHQQFPKHELTLEGVYFRQVGAPEPKMIRAFRTQIKKLGFKQFGAPYTEKERSSTRVVESYLDPYKNNAVVYIETATKPAENKYICYINVHFDRSAWILGQNSAKKLKVKVKRA